MKKNHAHDLVDLIRSTDISNDFAKKILIWFIQQTENFTQPIAVSVYTQDGEMFASFDDATKVFFTVNNIIFPFFKERDIEMSFVTLGGIFLSQNSITGFVTRPRPSEGYPVKNNGVKLRKTINSSKRYPVKNDGVKLHQTINNEACSICFSPWKSNTSACKIIELDLSAIETIQL